MPSHHARGVPGRPALWLAANSTYTRGASSTYTRAQEVQVPPSDFKIQNAFQYKQANLEGSRGLLQEVSGWRTDILTFEAEANHASVQVQGAV